MTTSARKWTDGGVDKQRGHSRRHAGFNGRYAERIAAEGVPTTRNKRSVWSIPTRPYSGAHFAVFPEALVEPCVLAASRAGDVILDPFMGSGTTAAVAQRLSRRWAGCEINTDNGALIAERLGIPASCADIFL